MTLRDPPVIIILLVIGVVVEWLAAKLIRARGAGVFGNLLIGIVGAFIGAWLLDTAGAFRSFGLLGAAVNAVIGAVTFLVIVRLVRWWG